MAENAPGFEGGTERGILPKNTQPLSNYLVRNGLVGTVTGAAPGAATNVVKARRQHYVNPNEESVAKIEQEALINRNSAAADVTALKSKFTKKKPSFAFPKDLSGNGGPAFTRS